MAETSSSSGGIGIAGCLFLIFLTLKLAEVGTVAHWSWWWVTSPLWLPLAVCLPILAIVVFITAIGAWLDRRRRMQAALRGDD